MDLCQDQRGEYTLKVIKFYINVASGIIIEGTSAPLKSFTLFHKLPKSINFLWGNADYSLGTLVF